MWAVALHAGAGVIVKSLPPDEQKFYTQALETALNIGIDILTKGGSSVDCVDAVVRSLEDCPLFNAGKGSVNNEAGEFELEASIMTGDGAIGSAVGLKHIKNPITLVKRIMEDKSKPYVMFSGDTAEKLADQYNVEKVENSYFFTQKRHDQWKKVQLEQKITHTVPADAKRDEATGTVGCAALDIHGKLCAGTSTGGLTNKPVGRIGDTPIIGAGTYANALTCAISGTGIGEKFIKNVASYDVHALMLYKGFTLGQAMEYVVKEKLQPGDGGVIGVDKNGEVGLFYNTLGMFRAGANSKGFFTVNIWDEKYDAANG